MVDLLIDPNEFTGADLVLTSAGVSLDHGMKSAVLISLFSDSRAAEGAPIEETADRRGWWGDLDKSRELGSQVWTFSRSKITPEDLERIRSASAASLAWLVEDGLAETVEVFASILPLSVGVDLRIEITRGAALRFSHLWDGIATYDLSTEGLRLALLFR
jgi:phage gp46-like protein